MLKSIRQEGIIAIIVRDRGPACGKTSGGARKLLAGQCVSVTTEPRAPAAAAPPAS